MKYKLEYAVIAGGYYYSFRPVSSIFKCFRFEDTKHNKLVKGDL